MRPRFLKLDPDALDELRVLQCTAEQQGNSRLLKRIGAVNLNFEGLTSGQISKILELPISRISAWLRNYEQWGCKGLLEKKRSGRPSLLNNIQKEELSMIIRKGPRPSGFQCAVWLTPVLGTIIEQQFGVQYHPGHVRKLRCRLGFPLQKHHRLLQLRKPSRFS